MKEKKLFLFLLLALFFLSRFLFIDSGLNLLEPDESDYQFVSDGFAKGWPILRGELYFEQFPLFHFLAYLLSFLKILGPYVPVRFLSIVGTLLVGISLYLWAKEKLSSKAALWTAAIFWLIPLSLFYSRSGTLDMLMLGFLSVSFYFFEKRNSQEKKWGILAGIFFTLGSLTKNTALVFLIYYSLSLLFNRNQVKKFFWFAFSATASILLSYGPYWYFFKNTDTTSTAANMFSRHLLPLTNIKVHLATFWIYIAKAGFYISWPIIFLFIFGVFVSLKKINKTSGIFLKAVPWLVFIFLFDHSARYFLLLAPAVSLFAGFALSQIKPSFLKMVFIFLILPASYTAFSSTLHQGVEKSACQVLALNKNVPIYTTFDPEKFERTVGKETSLLENEATQSGIVVVDQRKTELMLSLTEPPFKEAKKILKWLKENKKPVWEYNDSHPHFPATTLPNKFQIYLNET